MSIEKRKEMWIRMQCASTYNIKDKYYNSNNLRACENCIFYNFTLILQNQGVYNY